MAKKKKEEKVEKPIEKKGKGKVKVEPLPTSEDLFESISTEIENLTENMKKYKEKGIAAAAGRARKCTTNLARLFKDYRKITVNETKKKEE